MTVKELVDILKKCPQDYKVEVREGTDHWIVDSAEPDRPHKRSEWWKRRRNVVILR